VGPLGRDASEVFRGIDERPRGEAQSRRLVKRPTPESLEEHDIMTLSEVSEYLRVSPTTVYRLVNTGILPGFKLGKDWRFNKAQIRQFVKQETERQQQRKRWRK